MRYTATTTTADGRELSASGKTMPEAIRNADKLRKEYNAAENACKAAIREYVTATERGGK